MLARRLLSAFAFVVLIAGCGGGEDIAALSPQKFAAAQRADVHAAVTSVQAADQLFNAAEAAYPALFPGHKATNTFGPFAFRFYPETNMYLGVAVTAGAGYTLNGVYVVGTGFGTLANPAYQGLVTQFLPGLVIDSGLGGNKTLTITVSAVGVNYSIAVGSVPAPSNQGEFCSDLASDTVFKGIGDQAGGTMTINSCSFNGTTGTIVATISIANPQIPFPVTFSYTITYTYS